MGRPKGKIALRFCLLLPQRDRLGLHFGRRRPGCDFSAVGRGEGGGPRRRAGRAALQVGPPLAERQRQIKHKFRAAAQQIWFQFSGRFQMAW
ncbi:hypothetical protein ACP70R_026486 [Stipagrostis hirtigluma subsp. patula]